MPTLYGASAGVTGTPTAPTPSTSDSSTKLATTAYVKAQGYLTANQTIILGGDATGSGATAITVTLTSTGVTAGTYSKVTVDAKGRVTAGADLSASDIPTLTSDKISESFGFGLNVDFIEGRFRVRAR